MKTLASKFKILRLKGRIWLPNKQIPLQIQMVGPRFLSWFEVVPETVWHPKNCGLELVILSLENGVEEELNKILGKTSF